MKNLEELLQSGEYKNLIAGTQVEPMIKGVYLKAGQGLLKYGSVLGLTKEDNFAVLLDAAATDGSQVPVGVLVEDVDTGKEEGEAVLTQMYLRGIFNKEMLCFAEGTTLDNVELELKKLGIYTKKMYE